MSYEDDKYTQPGTTFRANTGGETGGRQRHARARLRPRRSQHLPERRTSSTTPAPTRTTASRRPPRATWPSSTTTSTTGTSERPLQPARLDHRRAALELLARSASAPAAATPPASTSQNSNYQILENIRSVIGEWNSILGANKANNLIVGYTTRTRAAPQRGELFPMVDILDAGTVYTTFGFEPFTPNNELRYNTFQVQDNFTWNRGSHTFTFGGDRRALPVGERVLPRLAERLRLQLARRLLHRRQRLPRQPEPDHLAGDAAPSSRCAGSTSPGRTSRCSRSRSGTAGSTRRTSGRPAATSR